MDLLLARGPVLSDSKEYSESVPVSGGCFAAKVAVSSGRCFAAEVAWMDALPSGVLADALPLLSSTAPITIGYQCV
jgi:hypothetical protein